MEKQQRTSLIQTQAIDRKKFEAIRILNDNWSTEDKNRLNILLKRNTTLSTAHTYKQWFLNNSRYSELNGAFNNETSFILENCSSGMGCIINCLLSPLILIYLLIKYNHIRFKQSLIYNSLPEVFTKKLCLLASIFASTYALTHIFDPKIEAIFVQQKDQGHINANNIGFLCSLIVSIPLWLFLFSKLTCMQRCNVQKILHDEAKCELKNSSSSAEIEPRIQQVENIISTLITLNETESAEEIFRQSQRVLTQTAYGV